jgi:chromate transporter
MTEALQPGVTLPRLAGYFLKLGALGFGGPVALANHMRRDLVEGRQWISELEYEDGLAIATACPGPLAYQLGVYCGYVRFGWRGAALVALTFALAPFIIVTLFAALYVRFAGAWELRALFYGVAPVIVALILKASWQLGRKTLKADAVAWLFAVTAAVVTVLLRKELIGLFLGAGLAGSLWFSRSKALPPPRPAAGALLAFAGAGAPAPAAKLFLFFFKTGLLVFGSGLVIAPFLKTYVVDQYHWLTDRQFLDAVAVGMVTPGPVVITATFVGFIVAGFWGSLASTVAIFLPSFVLVLVAAPLLQRHRDNPNVQGFIKGAYGAAIGTILGASVLLGKIAIGDVLTALLAGGALALLFRLKISNPLLIAAAAVIGLVAFPLLKPDWVMLK